MEPPYNRSIKESRRKLPISDYSSPLTEGIYNADLATEDATQVTLRRPIGYTERDAQVLLDVLNNINEWLSKAQKATQAHIDEITARSKTNRKIFASPEYFSSLAYYIFMLEQTLWLYCDAAWLRKMDKLRELLIDEETLSDTIRVIVDDGAVLIRMPHIAPTKQKPHSLPEDLLLAKLTSEKELPRFSECHATFCHVYPKKRSQLPKDVANYDYKRTIDILGSIFGFSDCSATFSLSLESILSDSLIPGTYILLEPKIQQKFKKSLLSKLCK